MKNVVFKIDWFTAIFEDCTFRDVLDWLGVDPLIYEDDFLRQEHLRSQGLDEVTIFEYEGISLECRNSLLYNLDIEDKFISVLPKIRLDISGTGLETLRQMGINVDLFLRDPTKKYRSMHVTRCDYSFDFINYKPEFLDHLIEYCESNHTESNRLCCIGLTAALRYSVRTGDQKTLYIGSTTSDRLLRIYDKKMQYTDPVTGLYFKTNPYEDPESWIRLEFQTRSKFADQFIYSLEDGLSVLKWIYERYAFADLSTPAHRREPAAFWQQLMNWDEIPKLYTNYSFCSTEIVPLKERVIKTVKRDLKSIMLAIAILSKNGISISSFFNEYLEMLQEWTDIRTCLIRSRKYRKLVNAMNACGITEDDIMSGVTGFYKDEEGKLRFKELKLYE